MKEKLPASIANVETVAGFARRHAAKIAAGHRETLWDKLKIRIAAFDAGFNLPLSSIDDMVRVARGKDRKIDAETLDVIYETLTRRARISALLGSLLSFPYGMLVKFPPAFVEVTVRGIGKAISEINASEGSSPKKG